MTLDASHHLERILDVSMAKIPTLDGRDGGDV